MRVIAVLLTDADHPGRDRKAGVVDLEGGVGDAVPAAQEGLQAGAGGRRRGDIESLG